jgi:hypothetical protein
MSSAIKLWKKIRREERGCDMRKKHSTPEGASHESGFTSSGRNINVKYEPSSIIIKLGRVVIYIDTKTCCLVAKY